MISSSTAFLFPAGLSLGTLQQIAFQAVDGIDIEQVTFDEGGGDVDLELAVPFLAGMDDVVVDAARLVLHGVAAARSIHGWHTVAGPGSNGTFVRLDEPSRLSRLVISELTPVLDTFLVLRAASPDPVPAAGSPLAADRDFPTAPMLPAPLGRLSVTGQGSGRLTVTVPVTDGQAWLVQYGTHASIDELAPVAGAPEILDVMVLPAAHDISLVLRARDGAPEQQLWQHPGAILPDAGDQLADFTPAGGRRLGQALAALNSAGGTAPTLSLPLRFHSEGAGTLGVRSRELSVRYVAYPVGTDRVTLALDGGWRDLVLDAPTRAPSSSSLRLTARHRGLALNAGSGIPPVALPGGGVRVRTGRTVAARTRWVVPDGGTRPLARVRLLAAPVGDTELVCEVRQDAAGAPGELVGPPAVRGLGGTTGPGWFELVLSTPVPLADAPSLWVTARTNRGELDWFTGEPPEAGPATTSTRVSVDGGSSWGEVDGGLGPVGAPLAQLLEQVEPATQPPPVVQVRIGESAVGELALVPGGAAGEYVEPSYPGLPAGLLAVLGAPALEARRRTTVSLWSPELLDITVSELTCSYDPFTTG